MSYRSQVVTLISQDKVVVSPEHSGLGRSVYVLQLYHLAGRSAYAVHHHYDQLRFAGVIASYKQRAELPTLFIPPRSRDVTMSVSEADEFAWP